MFKKMKFKVGEICYVRSTNPLEACILTRCITETQGAGGKPVHVHTYELCCPELNRLSNVIVPESALMTKAEVDAIIKDIPSPAI